MCDWGRRGVDVDGAVPAVGEFGASSYIPSENRAGACAWQEGELPD